MARLVKAEHESVRDVVTQLPNRRAFSQHLQKVMCDNRGKCAVLFADLDGFKAINDEFGHDIGDAALSAAGQRLSHMLRDTDFIARLGGDEFGIVVRRIKDNTDIIHILQNIKASFDMPFNIHMTQVKLGVSIGYSVYPDDGTDGNKLLSLADSRMYENKRAKKAV